MLQFCYSDTFYIKKIERTDAFDKLHIPGLFIDTNNYSKKDLLNSENLVAYAMQADRCTSNESLAEAIEHMLISKPNKHHEVSNLIDYVFKDRLADDEIKGLKKIIYSGEVDEIMITVRERLSQNDKRIFNDAIRLIMINTYVLCFVYIKHQK